MNAPHTYSKRILLAVSGMSPQIVTETLYALSVANTEQAFIPTEIHLISTNTGKNRAVLELLHPQTGKFHELCKDYDLQGIQFSAEQIYVIPDKNGVLLDDIKTPEENDVKKRAKLSRVLGKRALKSFHPRLFNIQFFTGESWSVKHECYSRNQTALSPR